jgi:hypothetical protein
VAGFRRGGEWADCARRLERLDWPKSECRTNVRCGVLAAGDVAGQVGGVGVLLSCLRGYLVPIVPTNALGYNLDDDIAHRAGIRGIWPGWADRAPIWHSHGHFECAAEYLHLGSADSEVVECSKWHEAWEENRLGHLLKRLWLRYSRSSW